MADNSILKNHNIIRITLTDANTEYSQVLSERPVKVTLSADDLTSQILFSFTSGASGTGKRVWNGAEWTSPGFIFGTTKTLYLQSPNAGAVAVIEEWQSG